MPTLAIGLTGCGKSEVPTEELKGLVVCSKQPTGMATHKVTIENAVLSFRRGGWKTIVEKDGSTLYMETGQEKR